IQQGNCRRAGAQRKHRGRAPRQQHGHAWNSQDSGARRLRHSQRIGDPDLKRREFLSGTAIAGLFGLAFPRLLQATSVAPAFRFADVTERAGIHFQHNSGAYGGKLLPETLGSGCAFLDYDADGWQDILLVNGMDWPGHKRLRSTLRLYKNNRNGSFTDVTKAAGLDVELYGMGVAVGDYNNDGFPDLFISCVGQSRLFENDGRGAFTD